MVRVKMNIVANSEVVEVVLVMVVEVVGGGYWW